MTTGIYQMFSPSGRMYIGQSRNIEARRRKYERCNCKNQKYIYRSLCKYGFDSHNFRVIYELPNDVEQSVIDDYERFYIYQFREAGIDLMNLSSGGNVNAVYNEEARENMAAAHRGVPLTEKCKNNLSDTHKKNYQKDPSQYKNLKHGWKVGEMPFAVRKKISEAHTGRVVSAEWVAKCKATKQAKADAGIKIAPRSDRQAIHQYSLEGELIRQYESMTEAESHGFKSGNISLCIAGKRKSHGGFIWKRL